MARVSATTFEDLPLWVIEKLSPLDWAALLKLRMNLKFHGPSVALPQHLTALAESDSITKGCDLNVTELREIYLDGSVSCNNFCSVDFHRRKEFALSISKDTSNGRALIFWIK